MVAQESETHLNPARCVANSLVKMRVTHENSGNPNSANAESMRKLGLGEISNEVKHWGLDISSALFLPKGGPIIAQRFIGG